MYLHSWNIFPREGICGVTYEKTCFTHRSEKGNVKNMKWYFCSNKTYSKHLTLLFYV